MKKLLFTLAALLCTIASVAQLKIDGRHVALDTLTNTLLATVPENYFNTDVTLSVQTEEGWSSADIGTVITRQPVDVSFSQITAEKQWHIALTRDDGTTRQATLQFTFLPIVQLLGQFGYDYQSGLFLFSHPDSARTDTLTASIKWRGGTTNVEGKHKRNYKVKFSEDHRLLGLRNDNNWMLDAGQPDVFRMRNRIAMDLWNRMATPPYYADQEPKALNGVRGELVEVFLQKEWRGLYNLSEFVDRKQLKLNKIDKQTGEIRGCLYKAINWNKTQMYDFLETYDNAKDSLFGFESKYPDLGDNDTVDWAPLVMANNFARNSVDEAFQQHIGDYFDIPVVIDYNIFYNVVNAVDNGGKNMYWAIYDKTATRRLTPVPWDLDATFGQRWGGRLIREVEEGYYNSPEFRMDFELSLTYRFFRDNFNDYLGQLNSRYAQLRQPGQPLHTDSIIAIVTHYYQAAKRSGAAAREEAKWSGDSDVWGDDINFTTEYAYICNWIRQRMRFIDATQLPLFYKQSYFEELSVNSPSIPTLHNHHEVYDLRGRKINADKIKNFKSGLYISGGKKYLVH